MGTDGEAQGLSPSADDGVKEVIQLAEKLKGERTYLGLSQDQVARVLGVPRAAVSAIESGKRRVSSLELKKLAELYGSSVDRLLGHEAFQDPTALALFRTTQGLNDEDKAQVLRFAEFLRGAGKAPELEGPGDPKKGGG